MAAEGRTLAVLGAGKAGEALIAGVLSSGWREPGEIVATARHQERVDEIALRHGVRGTLSNSEAVRGAGVVVIGVKPQDIEGLLMEISDVVTSESDAPESIQRSVMNSVRKARYSPRVENGEPAATMDVAFRERVLVKARAAPEADS